MIDLAEYCRPVAFYAGDYNEHGHVFFALSMREVIEEHGPFDAVERAPALDRRQADQDFLAHGCWVECWCGCRIGDDDYTCNDCEELIAKWHDEGDDTVEEPVCEHGRHPVFTPNGEAFCSQECMDEFIAMQKEQSL